MMPRLALACAGLLLAVRPAAAQEAAAAYEDHLGLGGKDVRITGSIATEVWVDDNIFLSSENEEDDLLVVIVPKVRVEAGEGDQRLQLDYEGRDRHHVEHEEFDGMEHFIDGDARLRAGAFRLEAWNRYQSRNDPFDADPSLPLRLDWLQNDCGGTLAADTDFLSVEAGGFFRRLELDDSVLDRFDHRRWEASALVAVEAAEATHLVAEAGQASTEYDGEGILDDFEFRWAAGGLRTAWGSGTFRASLKAGRFEVDVDQEAGVTVSDDGSGLYLSGTVDWQMGDRSSLGFQGQRRPLESIFSGWAVVQRADAWYALRAFDIMTASVGGYVETVKESEAGEDREGYGIHVRAALQLGTHLHLYGGWQRRSKDSDDATFQYDAVRAYAGVAVSW